MRADRLLSVLLLLQTRGRLTARELAEQLEVSERTVYRDIDALSIAGVPVSVERGPGGGCSLPPGYRTTLTGLSEEDVRTLLLSSAASPVADLGLGKALEDALLKLQVALPSARRQVAERVRQRILVDTAEWFRPAEPLPYLHMLQEAVWQDYKLRVVYSTGDARLVEPYGLVAKANIWYLVAASEGQMRTFRVSRIRGVTVTDERFQRLPTFDLVNYWAAACTAFTSNNPRYMAVVRLAPDDLPTLLNVLGKGMRGQVEQASFPDSDGRIRVNLAFDSSNSACTRLLSLGPLIEVLEPRELRARVAEAVERTAVFYARQPVLV